MNESEFDTLLTAMSVAVESFSTVKIEGGRWLAGSHAQGMEIHYVLEGRMSLKAPHQPEMVCGAGTLVLLPPGMERTIGAVSGAGFGSGEGLLLASGVIEARVSSGFGLLDSMPGPLAEDLADLPVIRESCRLILAELDGAVHGSRVLANSLMKVCIVALLRRARAGSRPGTGMFGALHDPRLGRAIAAVIGNPAAPHSVSSLAGAASMSRSAFAREFAANLAMTPMAFVARTRLQQGADLLSGTRLPVKMIAANIGFASRSHFSRAFSAAYGADPSSFRRAGLRPDRADAARRAIMSRPPLSYVGER